MFERAGVRETGQSSFLGSNSCLTFGRRVMLASFHTWRQFFSLQEAFRISLTKNSAFSFSTQFESPLGPGALKLLMCCKLLQTQYIGTSGNSWFSSNTTTGELSEMVSSSYRGLRNAVFIALRYPLYYTLRNDSKL